MRSSSASVGFRSSNPMTAIRIVPCAARKARSVECPFRSTMSMISPACVQAKSGIASFGMNGLR